MHFPFAVKKASLSDLTRRQEESGGGEGTAFPHQPSLGAFGNPESLLPPLPPPPLLLPGLLSLPPGVCYTLWGGGGSLLRGSLARF